MTSATHVATSPAKPSRILFIDMMRFIALLMMLQGHTVFQLLDRGIRDGNSIGNSIWLYLRGYTAPVFMTVSGMVFTYLLVLAVRKSGNLGMRLKNGLRRVGTLMLWGYLMRVPYQLLYGNATQEKIDIGLAMDVLHVIALGLLLIIVVFLACRPLLKKSTTYVAAVFFMLFLGGTQMSPSVAGLSFHEGVQPAISPQGLGLEVSSSEPAKGVVVKEVLPGSKAEKLGFSNGDIITQIGKAPIHDMPSLTHAEAMQVYGKFSPILVTRGEEVLKIDWIFDKPLVFLPNAYSFWLSQKPAPSGIASEFSILPWTGYLMFGAGFGALLAGMSLRNSIPRRLDLMFFAIGVGFLIWREIALNVDHIWLGGADSAMVFQRVGGVMLLASAMVIASHWIKELPTWVIQMSRNSLWLYIGHLLLLYALLPFIYQGTFGLFGTMVCVATMFMLMFAQTWLIEKKQQLGSWKSMLAYLTTRGFSK